MTHVKAVRREGPNVAAVKAVSSLSRIVAPGAQPSASNILTLFAAARRRRADSHACAGNKAMRGKNLAMLVNTPPGPDVSPLRRAAEDLGARVAELRFDEDGAQDVDLRSLSHVLTRMYDAIDCGALPASTVHTIEQEADVPVYAGLGLDDHPARALADLMTLCEHGLRPGPHAALVLVGDPRTPRSAVFLSIARQLGFALQVADPGDPMREQPAFLVDASKSPHWSLSAQQALVDEDLRSENHRCMIQTVLLDSLDSMSRA